ncbi:carbohydrate kinase [Mangrovibacter sp. MFB070]|uniref:bifunctional ADP-dependent NAD(P)H-hydrate dehydratase/NAD(P)H-hydrate epimerase n=1 Tax=Mangrovibacter sp. MFB070 TaxID=1224318 RepID=UPI0004D487AC|nr:bifunctional ADP-dependent NAD(P)H-hydrate dehydratase/NAD(P)H-hydrate epimerase [Mangrovibacter sp. MFB070]KEA54199.1 carbohydrate kinase [Mangrovibacter sp. MFB070]
MTDHYLNRNSASIPQSVWSADWLRKAEARAAAATGVSLYELMQRAGEAAFAVARSTFPASHHWLVLCGHGNNGGDGYVVARYAQAAGIQVTVLAVESDKPLPDEAQAARSAWLAAGGLISPVTSAWPQQVDLIVDGLLGTGIRQAPRENLAAVIEQVNQHPAPVLALDAPSGLDANTGTTPGAVVSASHTVTFIALKTGLLTGKARDVVGQLHYHALGLEGWLAEQDAPVKRFDQGDLKCWLHPRRATSHKGNHGRLVVIGGDTGTAGAIRMAGEAALRAGAGLVRVLTRPENATALLTARPELMVQALTPESLDESLRWADVVVIGPGLGQQDWGRDAFERVKHSAKPMLWDADALNLLAINPITGDNRVMTPHPGEAARLLGCSVAEIESDRLLSARRLVEQYGGCVVLKGAGTVIATAGRQAIIDVGNPGMASGGMGDVLSGIIGALLAQHLPLFDAACAGCVAHGAAADSLAARYGTRGMLAMDLLSALYSFVNPEIELMKS